MTSKQRAWQSTPKRFSGRPAAPKLCGSEAELLGGGPAGGHPPQVDGEIAGDCYNDLLSARGTYGRGEERLAPLGHRVIGWLVAQEAPGGLDQQVADAGVAVAGDAALQAGVTRGMLAGTKPGVAGHLAAVTETPPVADLAAQQLPGHGAQVAGKLSRGGGLQLVGKNGQLGIDRQQNALPAGQLRAEVVGQIQLGKGPLLPPLRGNGQPTQADR